MIWKVRWSRRGLKSSDAGALTLALVQVWRDPLLSQKRLGPPFNPPLFQCVLSSPQVSAEYLSAGVNRVVPMTQAENATAPIASTGRASPKHGGRHSSDFTALRMEHPNRRTAATLMDELEFYLIRNFKRGTRAVLRCLLRYQNIVSEVWVSSLYSNRLLLFPTASASATSPFRCLVLSGGSLSVILISRAFPPQRPQRYVHKFLLAV